MTARRVVAASLLVVAVVAYECDPGRFNASQRACVECKAGQQRNTGSATTPCELCAPGKAGVGGQCSSCSAGQAPNQAKVSW